MLRKLLPTLLIACSHPGNSTGAHDAYVDGEIDARMSDAASALLPGILVGGQSNAEGRSPCSNVTIAAGACDTRAYSTLFDEDTDSPIDPFTWQIDRGPIPLSPRGGIFGVEIPIGVALHDLGHDVGFAKAAVGSTTLADHWFHHCYASSRSPADIGCAYVNPTTGTSSPYPTGGPSLPDRLVAQGARLEALGYQIKVIIWIQGETDAAYQNFGQLYPNYQSLPFYSHYDENLTAMFALLHDRWPSAVIVFNRLNSATIVNYTHDLEVAQEHVAATFPGTHCGGAPCVVMISSEGLPVNGAHYTADGLWGLGLRFTDVIAPLLQRGGSERDE